MSSSLPTPPNGRFFDWVRFFSHLGVVIMVPIVLVILGFLRETDQFMTRTGEVLEDVVTRAEFEARLATKADRDYTISREAADRRLDALETAAQRLTDAFLLHIESGKHGGK